MTEERTFRTPGGNTVRLLCRPGTNDAMMAESSLEQDEYGIRGLTLPAGAVAVDAGAHIGPVCIGLAVDFPDLTVYAVEPVHANVDLLRENIALNGVLERVRVFYGAVAAPGTETVEIASEFEGGELERMHRFVGNQSMPEGTRSRIATVPGISLPDLLAVTDSGRIDLVITDCEGGEYQFLRGAALASVREIRGEYHDGRDRLERQLRRTHALTWTGDAAAGSGGFRAVRKG